MFLFCFYLSLCKLSFHLGNLLARRLSERTWLCDSMLWAALANEELKPNHLHTYASFVRGSSTFGYLPVSD